MLTELCQYLRNWFVKTRYFGSFKIEDGAISFHDGSPIPVMEGQYFRIIGSIFNDGVYKYGENAFEADEEFTGALWALAIPKEVILLSEEIERWQNDNAEAIASPYQSESFGGYSYTKSGGNSNGIEAQSLNWQSHFLPRLIKWRKL